MSYHQNGFVMPITQIKRPPSYWTYREIGGDLLDFEFKTADEALQCARDEHVDQCEGEVNHHEQVIEVVRFYRSPQTGIRHELSVRKEVLEYENIPSDYRQHNTMCHRMLGIK
jgi:hypothetical protein